MTKPGDCFGGSMFYWPAASMKGRQLKIRLEIHTNINKTLQKKKAEDRTNSSTTENKAFVTIDKKAFRSATTKCVSLFPRKAPLLQLVLEPAAMEANTAANRPSIYQTKTRQTLESSARYRTNRRSIYGRRHRALELQARIVLCEVPLGRSTMW